jgi:hypothetical protein
MMEELQRLGLFALSPLACLGLVVARPLMIKARHAVGDDHEDGFHDGAVVLFLKDMAGLDVHAGHPDQQVDEGNFAGPGRLELHVEFIVGGHDHRGIDVVGEVVVQDAAVVGPRWAPVGLSEALQQPRVVLGVDQLVAAGGR